MKKEPIKSKKNAKQLEDKKSELIPRNLVSFRQPMHVEIENTTYDAKEVNLFSRINSIPDGIKISCENNFMGDKSYEFLLLEILDKPYDYGYITVRTENPYQFEEFFIKKQIATNSLYTSPLDLLSYIDENHLNSNEIIVSKAGTISFRSELIFNLLPKTKLTLSFNQGSPNKPDSAYHHRLFIKNCANFKQTFCYNGTQNSLEDVFNKFTIKCYGHSNKTKALFAELFDKNIQVERIWAPSSIKNYLYFSINGKNGNSINTFVTKGFAQEKLPNQFLHILEEKGYSNDKKIITTKNGNQLTFELNPNEYVILLVKELIDEQNSNSFK